MVLQVLPLSCHMMLLLCFLEYAAAGLCMPAYVCEPISGLLVRPMHHIHGLLNKHGDWKPYCVLMLSTELSQVFVFVLRITQSNVDAHNTHAHSPLWTHVRKPYLYEHLRRTEPADLEIHKVTTGTSLSTETSPTTESIAPLNPGINPEKYEHPCQVKDLNPNG